MKKLISTVKNNIKHLIVVVLLFCIVYIASQFFYGIYEDMAISNVKDNKQKIAAVEQTLNTCNKQATKIQYTKTKPLDCENSYFVIGYQTGKEKETNWFSNLTKDSKPYMIVCHSLPKGNGEIGKVEVQNIPTKASCDNIYSGNFKNL